jgi:hypothetical protein
MRDFIHLGTSQLWLLEMSSKPKRAHVSSGFEARLLSRSLPERHTPGEWAVFLHLLGGETVLSLAHLSVLDLD